MLPYSDSRWTRIVLTLFFLVILGYGYYEARGLLFGPTIAVASEVITVHEAYIDVAGRAERIASLFMNGREITVTEEGDFSEPYLLAKGNNKITFDARDKYGHVTTRTLEVLYIPKVESESSIPLPTASTTTL